MTATIKFALVPVVSSPEQDAAGKKALSDNGVDGVDDLDALLCYFAMLAASPGSDLLERIVKARDNFEGALASSQRTHQLCILLSALDELGGGNG